MKGGSPLYKRWFRDSRYFLVVLLLLSIAVLSAAPSADRKTRHVILVTADGLRWQELFTGIDPLLMNEKSAGMKDAQALRERLWRPTPEERRQALMPFLWGELARRGVVLGNPKKGSSVKVSNAYRVSYPGYSEILTGRAQDAVIRGNDKIQNPTPTVLEFLRERLGLEASRAAIFGSWEVFKYIGESRSGSILINAGYEEFSAPGATPRLGELSAAQFDALTPWDSVRHDYVTLGMALEYLRAARPRLMYVALGETDDWAHDRRYDRTLQNIAYFDRCLKTLWETVQSLPEYRGSTTLVVTTDHGRGSRLKDWSDHGKDVAGAEQIWAVFVGPDTPATGEALNTPTFFQRDIAPTILSLLGIDYREYRGVVGKPIPPAVISE